MGKKAVKKRKISYQKIFNLISGIFVITCILFYGYRLIKFYKEEHKIEKEIVLADDIMANNKDKNSLKEINGEYYFNGDSKENYLEYSNLLWRIIKINSDKSVELVLDNSITVLSPGIKNNFLNSEINKWLNKKEKSNYSGILEKNLNNTNYYLKNTSSCIDSINDPKNVSCKKINEENLITIPSINDYINTNGQKGFMNNEENFYLINNDSENNNWYINNEGLIKKSDGNDILGIKPIVTIKNNIKLINGVGSKKDPYTIEEENNLFGGYVKLNNDIWRIFDVENEKIKLSLNDYLRIDNKEIDYKYSNTSYFHNDQKKGTLAYFLNNNYLNTLDYKEKIINNNYSNGIYSNLNNYDYSKTLAKTVDTKIANLSIGNIILNPLKTNYFLATGISEKGNQIYLMKNNFKAESTKIYDQKFIIPVITIDKNILNKGDGSIENPWEVNYEKE